MQESTSKGSWLEPLQRSFHISGGKNETTPEEPKKPESSHAIGTQKWASRVVIGVQNHCVSYCLKRRSGGQRTGFVLPEKRMKDPLRRFEFLHAKLDLVAQVCRWAVPRHRRENSSQFPC